MDANDRQWIESIRSKHDPSSLSCISNSAHCRFRSKHGILYP